MKLGYACVNNSLQPKANKSFRLSSFSEEKIIETVEQNLQGLEKIIEWNKEKGLDFFRISSETIPFASHPVCTFNWKNHFKDQLSKIGKRIKEYGFRISMHPGQFTVLNSPKEKVIESAISELQYHADFLNLLGLDNTAKIQIHIGGIYGNKDEAINRFCKTYLTLGQEIKDRLAIENDDYSYSLSDSLIIHEKTQIPIIFDNLHHECLNNGESFEDCFKLFTKTWSSKDGKPMVDYSSQEENEKKGKHTNSIDIKHFQKILPLYKEYDCDIMLEIKDKETSALKARAQF